MSADFSLREMTPADSPALAALTEQSPDGGQVTFSPRFHLPAYEVFTARNSDMAGVVAESDGVDGLVGSGRVSFGTLQFEGEVRPYALLSSLTVHPDHRRKGIASALAAWRIERALAHSGPDTLILADIQTGNLGSTANAKKWASQLGGHIVTSPVPMRNQPVPAQTGITIRPATPNDFEAIARHLNTFYFQHNFYRPQTAESLQAWLNNSPFDTPMNYYLVAVDRSNRPLAGIGIREEWRLMSVHIGKVPPLINFANLILKVIPPDRELRSLQAEKMWFSPDNLNAARLLWQTVRWDWRDRGSNLVVNFDPRSPLRQMLQIAPWMPSTSLGIALRSPTPMNESRLIDPLL